ncbi:MAG: CvpA family protein [Chitinophagaceae bacterium]
MNWVDILLLLILLLCVVAGWKRGFILGSISLLSWIGSLAAAYLFYPYTARGLDHLNNFGPWLLPFAFLLTLFAARLIIGFVAGYLVRALPENTNQAPVNKFLGIIPGAMNGYVYAVIISALLLSLPLKDSITRETRNSKLASQLAVQSEWANRKLAPVFDEAVRQTMNSLTVRPGSDESVSLTFKYDKAIERPGLENQMLQLVNKERTSRGLKPLQADPELTQVGRKHSMDMFVRGYFAHKNPDGKDPFDRMKAGNIRFLAAGENLALSQSVQIAHTNLMNSPGHRANILNPAFGRLGIGIMDGGYYGLMISQEFRN